MPGDRVHHRTDSPRTASAATEAGDAEQSACIAPVNQRYRSQCARFAWRLMALAMVKAPGTAAHTGAAV